MTHEELMRWAAIEDLMRKADMDGVKTKHDLVLAKVALKARRTALGLTASQASSAILEARQMARKSRKDS